MAASHLLDRSDTPRYLSLAEALYGRIVRKEYEVGSRLPTEKELAKEFGVAIMTVRQGVGLLVEKGLVKRHQGLGTFVVGLPATVANVAILCGDSLTVESAHYYRALVNRLQEGGENRRWTLRTYDEMNASIFGASVAEQRLQLLRNDHRANPFHGVIQLVPGANSLLPEEWRGEMPIALLEGLSLQSDVVGSGEEFVGEAVRYLAGVGRKRLFYLRTFWKGAGRSKSIGRVQRECRKLGLAEPEVLEIEMDTQGYEMEQRFYQAFRKIVKTWQEKGAPDGLIFSDDIALRSALPAIFQAGFGKAEEMTIFCYGNEDVRFCYGVPVVRYEISPSEIARHLLEVIDCRIRRVTPPSPLQMRGRLFVEQ